MKNSVLNFLVLVNSILLFPHVCLIYWGGNRKMIESDVKRWANIYFKDDLKQPSLLHSFIRLMTHMPEFRSIFYYRLGLAGKALAILSLYKPMPTLYIATRDIGSGLFIQHGFSTIIAAKKIGHNCWINQQVTIGFSNDTDCPTICDNVTICAGAKVIGAVTIGNNSIIGANAVVVKNVPDNCTVVGVPAYIVRRNGVKTQESL